MRRSESLRTSLLLITLLGTAYATTAPYTSRAVRAETPLDGRSCLMVFHGYPYPDEPDADYTLAPVAVAGVDGTSYEVDYRLHSRAADAWGAWQSPTESPAETSDYGDFLYYYESAIHDVYSYDQVEWRVTTESLAGIRTDNGGAVLSLDGEQRMSEPLYAAVGEYKDCWAINLGATIVYEDE